MSALAKSRLGWWIHDLLQALAAGRREWRRLTWLRKYRNPDECPF